MSVCSEAGAIARAEQLAARPGRTLVGITGAPGAGKSVLAERIADILGSRCALVGMDGFHIGQAELVRLGRADRKGAPDTFDVGGYVSLLRRLRAADEPVVYAPLFRREIEEPIAGAVPVPADVPLVVTEGNYLLLWPEVRALLDEIWYLDLDDDLRRQRLVARRIALGADEATARAWALGSDEANARAVAATKAQADLVVAPS